MKVSYTAEIREHPETRSECNYNVTGDETTTHRDLAESAAISAAMMLAEAHAESWEGGEGKAEYMAVTPSGVKSHTIRANLKGKAWGENWTGSVTVDGKRYSVHVR